MGVLKMAIVVVLGLFALGLIVGGSKSATTTTEIVIPTAPTPRAAPQGSAPDSGIWPELADGVPSAPAAPAASPPPKNDREAYAKAFEAFMANGPAADLKIHATVSGKTLRLRWSRGMECTGSTLAEMASGMGVTLAEYGFTSVSCANGRTEASVAVAAKH